MPFVMNEGVRPINPGFAPDNRDDPSTGQFAGAAFRQENLIGSFAANGVPLILGATFGDGPDPSFDPFADAERLKGYEDEIDSFAFANSEADIDRMKAQIDREREDRETLARGGVLGFIAAMGAGILDPTILIPVGGQIKKGERLLRASSRLALAAGGAVAAQEAGLHLSQATRAAEESAFAVGGSVLLGAALGGGVSLLTKKEFSELSAKVDADFRAGERVRSGGLSAEEAATTTLEDETITGIERLAKGLSTFDPNLQLQTSPSLVARKLGQSLSEGQLVLNKNLPRTVTDESGRARLELGAPVQQAVESFIRRKTEVFNGEIIEGLDDAFARYHFGRSRKAGDIARAGIANLGGGTGEKLSRGRFFEEVSAAMRRGDKHAIPEVEAEAKRIRPYFERLVDEGVELGMFGHRIANPDRAFGEAPVYEAARPSVEDTAESWLARLYDRDAIIRHEDDFIDEYHRWFIEKRDAAKAEIERQTRELDTFIGPEIDSLRGSVRALVKERNELFSKGRKEIDKARREAAKADAQARQAGTALVETEKRVRDLAARHLTAEQDAYYSGLLADINRGSGDYKPLTLSQFIRRQGGIKDWESMHSREHLKGRRLIDTKHGKPLDALREMAVEERYLPEDGSLAEFVDAIDADANGRFVYSGNDVDQVAYNEWLGEIRHQAEEAGLDLNSVVDLANWFEGARYLEKTKFKTGRIAEAERRERAALKRFEEGKGASELAEDALSEARLYARTLREASPDLTAKIDEYRKELSKAGRRREQIKRDLAKNELRADMTDAELREAAVRRKQRALSGPAGRLSYDGVEATPSSGARRKRNDPSLSGRFKGRVDDIPDVRIERFLVKDIERIARAAANSMIPDIELIRRFGSLDLELAVKELEDDFQKLNDEVSDGLKRIEAKVDLADEARTKARAEAGAKRDKIDKQRRQALRALLGIRDRLRNTYGLPADPNQIGYKVVRNVLNFNYIRLGGPFILSSFPDVGRVVFLNGVENFMGPALAAFAGKLSTVRLGLSEVRHAGPAFEMVNNTTLARTADFMDDYGRSGKVDRVLDAARANFAMLSLIAPWNHLVKSATGLTVQNRILKAAVNLKKGRISKKDAVYLTRLGIGQEDALKIADLYRAHGMEEHGVRWANTSAWNDSALADTFHNAMRKEIDRVIVTPGQEKPLMFSGPLGKLVGQFRSYNFAATQRVLLSATQGMAMGDAQALMAIMTQISIGMMVAKLKADAAGVDTSAWQTRDWLVEGIDRSGVLAVMAEYNMIAEHMTRGRVGLSALRSRGLISRYHSKNLLGALAGPAAGFLGDFQQGAAALTSGEALTEGDVAALRRLLPYQNLIGWRHLMDAAEQNVAAAVGA